MDVQVAFAQDYEHPCSRSTEVMPFTAAKMSRYAYTVPLMTGSSVETMRHRGHSPDVRTSLFSADSIRLQLPMYGHQRRIHNKHCFSTSAAASSAADPASTDGVPLLVHYTLLQRHSYVSDSEGNPIPIGLLCVH